MLWNTILVPHDFSASADHAAAIARDEAKLRGAKLVLLHVIELPYQLQPETVIVQDATGAPVNLREYALRSADAHVHDIAQGFVRGGVQTTPVIRFGNPVDEILKVIDEHRVDLVAMGTHGRTGLAHLLVGSVAERVVRTSKVPVLTVRHPDQA
jgi:nucleotide-binding universal stress UspA family protein